MNRWTSLMPCSTSDRSQRSAKTGVRKRVPAGAPNSAACCCGARWSRSLPLYATSAAVAIARRSVSIGTTSSRTTSHGVCPAPGHEAADWEWGDRKYGEACDQSALERPESLLVSRQCRGHTPVTVVLQSGSVEHVEAYGYFTPCSAGSLTGKTGTRPHGCR